MIYWFCKGNGGESNSDKIISYLCQGCMAIMNIGLIIGGAHKVNNECIWIIFINNRNS